MAKWIEVQKSGTVVKMADGTPLAVGQQVSMGLGSIELRNTERVGLHIVRLSGSGHFKYSLKLSRDGNYRLGPDRGHRVVTPSEETDPIKRILREMDIPVSNLIRATEPTLEVGERWYDNDHCPNGRPTKRWITDGRKTEVNSETREQPHGYFGGGGYDNSVIEGASYAVCVDSGRYMNGCDWTRPGRIVVWMHCDQAKLANVLAPIVYGSGADYEYVKALMDSEAARRWIAEKFEAPKAYAGETRCVSFQHRGGGRDGFSVTGTDHTKITSLPGGGWGPIARLVHTHGLTVVDLPSETAALLRAMSDKDAAREYLTSRYTVERDEHRVRFMNPENGKSVASYGPDKPGSDYITTYTGGGGGRADDMLLVVWAHGWDFIQSLVA